MMNFTTISILLYIFCLAQAYPTDNTHRINCHISDSLYCGDSPNGIRHIQPQYDFGELVWLERRISRAKKDANSASRLERKKEAKKQIRKARMNAISGHRGNGVGLHAVIHSAVQRKKQELKDVANAKHSKMKAAGAEHRRTKGLPPRTAHYDSCSRIFGWLCVRPDLHFTGKAVRKANFDSHIRVNGKNQRPVRIFNNYVHKDPGSSGTTRPIGIMSGNGHEFPLSGGTSGVQVRKSYKSNPVRIISQTDAGESYVSFMWCCRLITTAYMKPAGEHYHVGVVAHEQSRLPTHPAKDDHFQIHPDND
uniref:Uncharacterized protein n=1 Tax=Psilocybe cubensis TaxID=181762 RepID=A0A8H7Y6Z2_PSICU